MHLESCNPARKTTRDRVLANSISRAEIALLVQLGNEIRVAERKVEYAEDGLRR